MNTSAIRAGFIFPGQGSHYVGMGKTLCNQYSEAKITFEEAEDALGIDLRKICFYGPISELNKPNIMFAALLTVCVSAYRAFHHSTGIEPVISAGHSLGEYAALVCGRSLSFIDALQIVSYRGLLAANFQSGYMAIIEDLDDDIIENECQKLNEEGTSLSISAYNSKTQTVVSGQKEILEELIFILNRIGGRVTPIYTSPPLHCPILLPTISDLKNVLKQYKFLKPLYPVISNVYAREYENADCIVEALSVHMSRPVQWLKTMNLIKAANVDVVVELGPQNKLSQLMIQTFKEIPSYSFCQEKGIDKLYDFINNKKNIEHRGDMFYKAIIRCVSISTSTKNMFWEFSDDLNIYANQLFELLNAVEKASNRATQNEVIEAINLMMKILDVKGIKQDKQTEYMRQIINETNMNQELVEHILNFERG